MSWGSPSEAGPQVLFRAGLPSSLMPEKDIERRRRVVASGRGPAGLSNREVGLFLRVLEFLQTLVGFVMYDLSHTAVYRNDSSDR